LGGPVVDDTASTLGEFWPAELKKLPKGPLLLAATAVDFEGVTSFHPATVKSKAALLNHGRPAYLLVDSTKWNVSAPYRVAELRAFDEVVTDSNIPKEVADKLLSDGIQLTVVD
jgi:DeoR/GlpR family transcriptional regulator of sugar metabolism